MDNQNPNLNSAMQSIAKTLWNGRKIILGVALTAFVVSLIASFLIKPQYKAIATIFPPIANQVSKELLTENKQEGLTSFGETEEMEQFLQILNSRTLKEMVVEKLNLRQHWDIEPNTKSVKYKTFQKFDDKVNIRPTRYQSINIEVMDRDPQWAATIANTMVDFSDSIMRSVKAQVAVKALRALENQFSLVEKELASLQDSLALIMNKGIINPDRQAKVFYSEYLNALLKSNKPQLMLLEKEISRFGDFGAKHVRYTAEIMDLAERLNDLRKNIVVARIEANQEIPTQFIIDRADVPDKKAYPKRLLIVLTATLSAILLAAFLLLFEEYLKGIKH